MTPNPQLREEIDRLLLEYEPAGFITGSYAAKWLALIEREAKQKVEEAVEIVDRIHMRPNPQSPWLVEGLKMYVLSKLFTSKP